MTNVLVTGAGGYVGGRLLRKLAADGYRLRALVREPAPRLDVAQSVFDLAEARTIDLENLCGGIDTVVHLAGENEVDAARAPAAALASTIVATERLAEAAVRTGVRRFVYMSTVHVYGARMVPDATLTEGLRPEPRATYAISRLASEHVASALASDAFELVVFRLTNSVGAPDHPNVDRWTLVTNDLCRQAALEGRLELRTSGAQWRDFIALEDVCSMVAAACRTEGKTLPSGTYNLGSGRSTTVRMLAETVQDVFARVEGKRPDLRAPDLEPEALRPKPYHVSVEHMRSRGLTAETSLVMAVEETARFCLQHREELR